MHTFVCNKSDQNRCNSQDLVIYSTIFYNFSSSDSDLIYKEILSLKRLLQRLLYSFYFSLFLNKLILFEGKKRGKKKKREKREKNLKNS